MKKAAKTVVIGTGTATSTKAGSVTIVVKLTSAAKTKFKAKSAKKATHTSLKASLVATLTQNGQSAKPVTKPVTFRK